jgi:excisionase family DNA binding protein
LTTREAATLAGVSERWVRALARNEDVQASRVSGGAWAIDISSLSAWIRQRREDHEKAA